MATKLAIQPGQSRVADLIGAARLATGAVGGVADLAQAVHMAILGHVPAPVGRPLALATSLVYRSVRGVAGLAGGGLEHSLARLQPLLGERSGWAGREAVLAALNGVLGDRLAQDNNPLAIPMQFRRNGQPLAFTPPSAAPGGRVLVLAHGLCMNDLQWQRNGHDHGAMLERERGYTPVYLHYNTGRHISENGDDFAHKLEALLAGWPVPVEELVIVGHSMGGLLARSACHYGAQAGHRWLAHLSKLVFLGSPHQGAPLERGGNWVHLLTDFTPYTAPFTRLAKLRSAGITDLRHGSLLDSDWVGRDRFAHGAALPAPVPLPEGVACYAVAGTIGKDASQLSGRMAGDGLVPLASALGQHPDPLRSLAIPVAHQATVYGVNHMVLLDSPQVAQHLLAWL
ncbi:esterase/lipase family protein [Pseudoduganella aquatica]|uniref:Alpha/beta hydrolase n=1 Tax=Pseudoduganella aquatica TaxID=2660641 RepID=A0A7X4KL94_9BURK|nr:alpha/beta hydrolase [Pseudoduganella aquatica]MYN05816.1 alpha/beta hydrolase [Pseudoduganella aquatica]